MRSQVGARRINCQVAERTTSRSISFSFIGLALILDRPYIGRYDLAGARRAAGRDQCHPNDAKTCAILPLRPVQSPLAQLRSLFTSWVMLVSGGLGKSGQPVSHHYFYYFSCGRKGGGPLRCGSPAEGAT